MSVKERCYLLLCSMHGHPISSYALDKLEKVQRAAKFVYSDFSMYSSVTNILNWMHWTTLADL